MNRLSIAVAVMVLTLAGVFGLEELGGAAYAADVSDTGFISMATSAEGEEWPAVLYVPEDYDPDKKWPLIVFLHGMGERGSDGQRQTEVGIGEVIRSNPERFPCLVYMPQCSTDTFWSSATNEKGAPADVHITQGIETVLGKYNIDEDRVSLTGLSMGGYGTFAYGAKHIDRFSALMPICGGGNVDDAAALAKRPMWVFHGGADPVVNPEQSRRMIKATKQAGGDVRYTEYEGVGHNSWDNAYGSADAIAWLLAQKR